LVARVGSGSGAAAILSVVGPHAEVAPTPVPVVLDVPRVIARLGPLAQAMRSVLAVAMSMLDAEEQASSDAWFDISRRLERHTRR
jgi:hypothetical protein